MSEQLPLAFDPCPCGPARSPDLMEWCGFKRTFTYHDWCERFYVGVLRDDGTTEPCACPRHPAERRS